MRKCGYCGGSRLKRVHRTFVERFSYLAIYECRDCENEEFVPRRYTYHFGEEARCPNCGTYRVTKLRGVDKIDKMVTGPLNRVEKMMGGNLYHCVFCRLQFYDRRKAAPRTVLEPIPPSPVEAEAVPAAHAAAAHAGARMMPHADVGVNPLITPPPEDQVKPLITPPPEWVSPLITPAPERLVAPLITPPPELAVAPVVDSAAPSGANTPG